MSQLSYGGRLAGTIHAHNHDYFRHIRSRFSRARRSGIQDFKELLFDQPLQFSHIFDLLAIGALSEVAQDLLGRFSTQVGGNQDGLKVVEGGAINLLGKGGEDRKSTRLNSSHVKISYAVFCLKKKK